MITKSERKLFKKAIGYGHIKKIQQYLRDANIKRDNGREFSATHIANVFNGVEHEAIEAGIFLCAKYYKEETKKQKQQKTDILKSLKTTV